MLRGAERRRGERNRGEESEADKEGEIKLNNAKDSTDTPARDRRRPQNFAGDFESRASPEGGERPGHAHERSERRRLHEPLSNFEVAPAALVYGGIASWLICL